MLKRLIKIVVFLLFYSIPVFSTHIVGGEIYYECLGNNQYRIVLKVYRDCYNGLPWFDSPATVAVYDSGSVLIRTIDLIPPGSDTLPINITNPCIVPPANVCVEQCIYSDTVTLPPIPGGYTLVYQRCCRNNTILNLVSPGDVGSTYFTTIPDTTIVKCNNSPHFTNYPPIYICAGVPLQFDHSATDADGDSLVYELCDTYHGASSFSPMPNPPSPPPYTAVPWAPGFNGSYPIKSNPAIKIDPKTGMITGTPTMIGQWVIGVCVREYRNGVLVEIHKRDFQFNIINCSHVIVSSIPAQQTFCFGKTVNFLNNSLNANTFHWDFGVPTLTNDTSNLKAPGYTYQDTGVYVITLVANPGTICADTATSTFKIYPPLEPKFIAPPAQCLSTNSFNFNGSGVTSTKSTYAWNFGPSAIPSTSTKQNPTGITFIKAGTFAVTFTISDHGCTQIFTDSVSVLPSPTSQFSVLQTTCFGKVVTFINQSTNATNYRWDFGVPALQNDTSRLIQPNYTYPDTGTYTITLITDPRTICADTITGTVRIYPPLMPKFVVPGPQCVLTNSYNFNGTGITTSRSTYSWNFGVNATPATSTQQNPSGIIFSNAGKQVVQFTITDRGCSQSFIDTVIVLPAPIPQISAQVGQCINNNNFNFNGTGNSTSSATYSWTFGSNAIPTASTLKNMSGVKFNAVGKFPVTFSITDHGCTVSTTDTVTIYPLPTAKFDMPPKTGCKPFRVQFTDSSLSQLALNYLWKFGDGQTSTQRDPVHIYTSSGIFNVSLTIVATNGCVDTITFTKPNIITVLPGPDAALSADPTSTTISDPAFAFTDESLQSIRCKLFFGDGDSSFDCSTHHVYKQVGTYTVTQVVINEYGCLDTNFITVEVTPDIRVWIPNAFTPNSSGLNDVFMPITEGIAQYHFMVFDRWGQLVFDTTEQAKGWDGKYKRDNCPEDVYVYKIELTDIKEHNKTYIGHVTLIR
ncbi:MAG: PKD domain-containing protein [Bacteroidetes bacterium]|nr:PKD domain-containing protein [Bacteroidota bacterium]